MLKCGNNKNLYFACDKLRQMRRADTKENRESERERKAEIEDNNNLERFTNLCWIYYAAVALVFIWAIGQNVGQL